MWLGKALVGTRGATGRQDDYGSVRINQTRYNHLCNKVKSDQASLSLEGGMARAWHGTFGGMRGLHYPIIMIYFI